jgi:hypothetical protein
VPSQAVRSGMLVSVCGWELIITWRRSVIVTSFRVKERSSLVFADLFFVRFDNSRSRSAISEVSSFALSRMSSSGDSGGLFFFFVSVMRLRHNFFCGGIGTVPEGISELSVC